jgi:hypothetical protein
MEILGTSIRVQSSNNHSFIKNWNQWYEQHNPLWIAEKIELDTKTKTLDTIISQQ